MPTHTAMEVLYRAAHSNQMAPTAAKGTPDRMMNTWGRPRKFR